METTDLIFVNTTDTPQIHYICTTDIYKTNNYNISLSQSGKYNTVTQWIQYRYTVDTLQIHWIHTTDTVTMQYKHTTDKQLRTLFMETTDLIFGNTTDTLKIHHRYTTYTLQIHIKLNNYNISLSYTTDTYISKQWALITTSTTYLYLSLVNTIQLHN